MADANIEHEATLAEEALPIGTVLSGDQFTITGHLGAGGFGITYRAKDNVLGRTIVIKECFPADICARDGKSAVARSKSYAKSMRSIVKMFMREARSLAKLRHSQTRMMEVAGRRKDPCVPLVGQIDEYDQEFLQAIDFAMQIHPGDRLQSAAKWRSMISNSGDDAISISRSEARPTGVDIPLDLELSLSKLVKETNDEVRRTSRISVDPKPVVAPQDNAPKPAWIDEFNQELQVTAAKTEPAAVEPDVSQNADFITRCPRAGATREERIFCESQRTRKSTGLIVPSKSRSESAVSARASSNSSILKLQGTSERLQPETFRRRLII